MSLAGTRLGPYEIVSLLGAGGMGEVYRAVDTRLGRHVAVKVLPPGTASSAARKARFEREARAIAALSHPNICAIHDVGSEAGTEFLVMELLDGESLAERLARGPLPITQVLRYGAQIADALQQAHRAGIVHRDLKPGNIMLTGAGVKLLDFGLAKTAQAKASDQDDVPTVVAPLTADGTLLGTVAYMAPEQIEARDVDHRADIFALGIILYEMATGQRPFSGSSPTAIIAAIVTNDPPSIRSLQPSVSPALERIISTALEKNRDDRWQTAQDVGRQLRWILDTASSSEAPPRPGVRPQRRLLLGAVVAIAALLLAAGGAYVGSLRRTPAAEKRLEFTAPPGLAAVSGFDSNAFAIAPDGRSIAFLATAGGERFVAIRDLGSYEVRRVEGSDGAFGPFWSSDGEWIGFSARGKLWKARRTGDSAPEPLCDVGIGGAIATWRGDTILFALAPEAKPEIHRVPAGGGTPVALTHPPAGEWRHAWPHFLPDGKHFVYAAFASGTMNREIVLATIDGSKRAVLLRNVSGVRSGAGSRLLFVRDGRLLAQELDVERGTMVGEAQTVADDIAYFYPTARADFDATPGGTIVYLTDHRTGRLAVVSRSGVAKRVFEDGRFFDVTVSPDGTKAATTLINGATGLGDVWIYDLARGIRDRFTTDPGMEFSPVWSRDGRALLFASAQGGSVPQILFRPLNGSQRALLKDRGRFRWPTSVSPDGETVYFVDRDATTKNDIYRVSLRGSEPETLLKSEFMESDAVVSPDGVWLAYSSDATGRREVYLQQLDAPGSARIRVSPSGGSLPRWGRTSSELFYLSSDARTLLSARTASGRWEDASTEPLFRNELPIIAFAPRNDGFVILDGTPGPRHGIFHVVLDWSPQTPAR